MTEHDLVEEKPPLTPIKVSTSPLIDAKSATAIPKPTRILLLILLLIALLLAYLHFRPQPTISTYQECIDHPQSVITQRNGPVCLAVTGTEFPAPTPTSIPIPTPVSDPQTLGWQTEQHLPFSLLLPPDWLMGSPATSSGITSYIATPATTSSALIPRLIITHQSWNNSLEAFLTNQGISSQSAQVAQEIFADQKAYYFVDEDLILYTLHPENYAFTVTFGPGFQGIPGTADTIIENFHFIYPSTQPEATASANF